MRIAKRFMLYVGGGAAIIALVLAVYFGISAWVFLKDIENEEKHEYELNSKVREIFTQKVRTSIITVIVFGFIGLLLFLFELYYVSKRIVAPINKTVDFSNRLAKGDFSAKLPKGGSDDEIGELIKSLNYMRDRLRNNMLKLEKSHIREKNARKEAESVNSFKTDFLTNISLELRNPLNSIVGFTNLIVKEIINGKYDKDLERKVLTIHHSAQVLNDLIINLLEMSKIDSGEVTLNIRDFDTMEFIREVLNFNLMAAEEKKISLESHFTSDLPKKINTDRDILFHILTIILSDMIRNADPGARISFGTRISSGRLAFYVQDSGRGKASEPLAEIFHKYIKNKTEQIPLLSGSLMMNLTIAKGNAELLGGELSAQTGDENSSIFHLTFLLDDIEQPAGGGETSPVHTATNWGLKRRDLRAHIPNELKDQRIKISKEPGEFKNILLAEDNQANLLLVENMLEGTEFKLDSVEDGQTCLEHLGRKHYDLLLLDLQLPKIDGYEVLDQIRKTPELKNLPVVIITAFLEPGDKQKMILAGADECFVKPINIDETINTIKRLTS